MRTGIDADFRFAGRLDYIDQEGVDRGTGTLSLRAKFDNSDGDLVAGLFVRDLHLAREAEHYAVPPEVPVGLWELPQQQKPGLPRRSASQNHFPGFPPSI